MILPVGFDLDQPTEALVEQLVATGAYTEAEARDLVAILRDPDAEPIE